MHGQTVGRVKHSSVNFEGFVLLATLVRNLDGDHHLHVRDV
jgi:hypothetical protein